MYMKNRLLLLLNRKVNSILFLQCIFFTCITPSVEVVRNIKQLKSFFYRHEYVCLLLLPETYDKKVYADYGKRVVETINRLSIRSDFHIARVAFARFIYSQDVVDSLQQYGINLSSNEKVYFAVCFDQMIVSDAQEKALLEEPKGYVQIEEFIQRYIGHDIEKIVEQYKKDVALKKERAAERTDEASVNVHMYYGSPYYRSYYWDWPWIGPSYGGWYGGRWHHHGHHRGHGKR